MDVMKVSKQLEKMMNEEPLDDVKALELLRVLQGLSISLEDLEKTRIGMSVNKIRKQTANSDVAALAKKLIKGWKKMLDSANKSKGKLSAAAGGGNGDSQEARAADSPMGMTDSPNTPPKQESSTPSQPTAAASTATASSNREAFASSSYPSLPMPRDPVRSKSVEMLTRAMQKNAPETDVSHCQQLALGIEEALFKEMPLLDGKYRNRLRSRVANLQDTKNLALCANVVSGAIAPERIAVMTAEEMASDEMKKLRKHFTKESIDESQMTVNSGTTTDLLKCSKCKQHKCTYNQLQTRSADEPMTTFVFCNNCGHRWKFN